MTEKNTVWLPARRALSPYGVLKRVENRVDTGTPDVAYSLLGAAGWWESKSDLSTLTLDQVLWAEGWAGSGGLCHLLYRHRSGWALYDAGGTRALYVNADPKEASLLWTTVASFPVREVLIHLAPPSLRQRTGTSPSFRSTNAYGSGATVG